MSMRVERIFTIETPRLQEMALIMLAQGTASATIRVPAISGRREFSTRMGIFFSIGRQQRRRMQNLGAEIGELGRLGEGDGLHAMRFRHELRIAGHHAIDVGPNLNLLGAQCRRRQWRR